MDIKAFIRELLFSHDCVIIPGFGGFIANYAPSRIDTSTDTFYPPVRKISFNRNLSHNDGLLISRISFTLKVNYGEARRLVENFSRDLAHRLLKGEKIVFDHIGTFFNNHENSVQFEPFENVNFLFDTYGLEPFQCLPLRGYDIRKRVTRHLDREPVRQYSTGRALWRAAVIIPVLALIVIIPLKTNLFRTKVESSAMNPLITAEFENNKRAVDSALTLTADTGTTVKPIVSITDTFSLQTPSIPVTVPTTPVKRYGVITGSFRSEENARTHIADLKADGFDPELVAAQNGFYRVFAMTCSDLETAASKRDSLAEKFPGSWVSKR